MGLETTDAHQVRCLRDVPPARNQRTDDLAGFVVGAGQADLTGRSRAVLKRNVLDSIACAVGSLNGELIATIREHAEQFSGRPTATLVGGGRASEYWAGRVRQTVEDMRLLD